MWTGDPSNYILELTAQLVLAKSRHVEMWCTNDVVSETRPNNDTRSFKKIYVTSSASAYIINQSFTNHNILYLKDTFPFLLDIDGHIRAFIYFYKKELSLNRWVVQITVEMTIFKWFKNLMSGSNKGYFFLIIYLPIFYRLDITKSPPKCFLITLYYWDWIFDQSMRCFNFFLLMSEILLNI